MSAMGRLSKDTAHSKRKRDPTPEAVMPTSLADICGRDDEDTMPEIPLLDDFFWPLSDTQPRRYTDAAGILVDRGNNSSSSSRPQKTVTWDADLPNAPPVRLPIRRSPYPAAASKKSTSWTTLNQATEPARVWAALNKDTEPASARATSGKAAEPASSRATPNKGTRPAPVRSNTWGVARMLSMSSEADIERGKVIVSRRLLCEPDNSKKAASGRTEDRSDVASDERAFKKPRLAKQLPSEPAVMAPGDKHAMTPSSRVTPHIPNSKDQLESTKLAQILFGEDEVEPAPATSSRLVIDLTGEDSSEEGNEPDDIPNWALDDSSFAGPTVEDSAGVLQAQSMRAVDIINKLNEISAQGQDVPLVICSRDEILQILSRTRPGDQVRIELEFNGLPQVTFQVDMGMETASGEPRDEEMEDADDLPSTPALRERQVSELSAAQPDITQRGSASPLPAAAHHNERPPQASTAGPAAFQQACPPSEPAYTLRKGRVSQASSPATPQGTQQQLVGSPNHQGQQRKKQPFIDNIERLWKPDFLAAFNNKGLWSSTQPMSCSEDMLHLMGELARLGVPLPEAAEEMEEIVADRGGKSMKLCDFEELYYRQPGH